MFFTKSDVQTDINNINTIYGAINKNNNLVIMSVEWALPIDFIKGELSYTRFFGVFDAFDKLQQKIVNFNYEFDMSSFYPVDKWWTFKHIHVYIDQETEVFMYSGYDETGSNLIIHSEDLSCVINEMCLYSKNMLG